MILSNNAISSWMSRSISTTRRSISKRYLSSSNDILAPRLDGLDKPTVWHEFSVRPSN